MRGQELFDAGEHLEAARVWSSLLGPIEPSEAFEPTQPFEHSQDVAMNERVNTFAITSAAYQVAFEQDDGRNSATSLTVLAEWLGVLAQYGSEFNDGAFGTYVREMSPHPEDINRTVARRANVCD